MSIFAAENLNTKKRLMDKLDIYKFLHNEDEELADNCRQAEWQEELVGKYDSTGKRRKEPELHLTVWIQHNALLKFAELLGPSAFDDGGVECWLRSDGSVAIRRFDELLEEYGINAEEIIPKQRK